MKCQKSAPGDQAEQHGDPAVESPLFERSWAVWQVLKSVCWEGIWTFIIRGQHVDSVTVATGLRRRSHDKRFLSIFTIFVFLGQIRAQSRYATHIQHLTYADRASGVRGHL